MLRILVLFLYAPHVVHSSARLAGFEEDLHLQGSQYATLLSIIYVGFIIMQVPA